jgi:Arc/MetJ family transcription regulator
MRKTTIYLDDIDDDMIAQIKADHGLTDDAPAVRLALRSYRSRRKR